MTEGKIITYCSAYPQTTVITYALYWFIIAENILSWSIVDGLMPHCNRIEVKLSHFQHFTTVLTNHQPSQLLYNMGVAGSEENFKLLHSRGVSAHYIIFRPYPQPADNHCGDTLPRPRGNRTGMYRAPTFPFTPQSMILSSSLATEIDVARLLLSYLPVAVSRTVQAACAAAVYVCRHRAD